MHPCAATTSADAQGDGRKTLLVPFGDEPSVSSCGAGCIGRFTGQSWFDESKVGILPPGNAWIARDVPTVNLPAMCTLIMNSKSSLGTPWRPLDRTVRWVRAGQQSEFSAVLPPN